MKKGKQPKDIFKDFERASQAALEATANRLENEFTTQITQVKWKWKGSQGVTQRRKGAAVTELRNIIDTGEFRKSQTRIEETPTKVVWEWQVDYSAIIHDGGKLKNGADYPKRPWTTTAELEVKPLEYYVDILERELDG